MSAVTNASKPIQPIEKVPTEDPSPTRSELKLASKERKRAEKAARREHPGAFRLAGAWLGRSIYLLVFVTAVALAAAAATHAWDLRSQHDDDVARIAALEQSRATALDDLAGARDSETRAQRDVIEIEAELEASKLREEQAQREAAAFRDAFVAATPS